MASEHLRLVLRLIYEAALRKVYRSTHLVSLARVLLGQSSAERYDWLLIDLAYLRHGVTIQL